MENLGYLILIFLVVQSIFILLDCFTLWEESGQKAFRELLSEQKKAFAFLLLVWIGYFTIQSLLMAAMPSIESTVVWFSLRENWPSLPEAGPTSLWMATSLFAATYVIAGFWDYAIHRWMLHTRWCWFLHENHHLPTQVFNGMPGISVRPFVAPTTFLTYLGTIATIIGAISSLRLQWLLPIYLQHLPGMILLFALIGSASHSCFLRRFHRLHLFLKLFFVTTPLEHVLHHGARIKGNYGNFSTLWDRLFGTYLDPLEIGYRDLELGLCYDQDFLGTLTAGRWKLSQRSRASYAVNRFCNLSAAEAEIR